MAEPTHFPYPSPLAGYEDRSPLSTERNEDGKSLVNPPPSKTLSKAYTEFTSPITNDRRGGFDIHIYFLQTQADELEYAKALHSRIRYEFPELRIYPVFDRPVGPHPVGMFEVNVFTPHQFGAFVSWLVVNRGPLSALIHPNTLHTENLRDHMERAAWLGQPYPLQTRFLAKSDEKARAAEAKTNGS